MRADHHIRAPGLDPSARPVTALPRPNAASARSRHSQPSRSRAMKHRAAVAVREAIDRRQIVDDAGRNQQEARPLLAAVVSATRKWSTSRQAPVTPMQRKSRRSARARGGPVRSARAARSHRGSGSREARASVGSGLAQVAEQDAAPAAAEHQRRAQARRPTAHDNHVEHRPHQSARPSPAGPITVDSMFDRRTYV